MSEYAMHGRYGNGIDWDLNFSDENVQTEYTMFKAASIPNYCIVGLGLVTTIIFSAYWGTEVAYSNQLELSLDFFILSLCVTLVPVWLVVWMRSLLFTNYEHETSIRTALIILESWTILLTTVSMAMVVFSRTEHLPMIQSLKNHRNMYHMSERIASILVSSLSVAILLFLPMLSSIFFSFALWSVVVIANIVSYTTIIGCVIIVLSTSTSFHLFAVMLILSVIQYFYRLQQMRLFIHTRIHFKGLQEREHERNVAADRLKKETCNLVASLCHDLKTPLTALAAAVDNMKEALHAHGELEAGMQGTVVELAAIYHMLLTTVNRSMDFTKIVYDVTLAPTLEVVDLISVLQDLKDFIAGLSDHHSLTIEPLPDTITMQIITDRQWLLDNIMVLASNGVKYSPTSHVHLRIYLTQDTGSDELLHFEFTNYGPVIPLDKLQSLWDAPDFSQQRAVGGTGLSLFCLSKQIQSMHGQYGAEPLPNKSGMMFWFTIPYRPDGHYKQLAQIEMLGSSQLLAVLNESRESYCATSTIPYIQDDEEEKKEEIDVGGEYQHPPHLSSYGSCMLPEEGSGKESDSKMEEEDDDDEQVEDIVRVLVVDDSPLLLKMFSREIRSARNFEVHTCTTGMEALVRLFPNKLPMVERSQSRSSSGTDATEEKGLEGEGIHAFDEMMSKGCEAVTFDLILMDLQMPVMDGFTAIRAIRAAEEEKHTIHHLIVAMSANSDQSTMTDAYNAGADYFVPKPFKMDTLQQTVLRFMKLKKK